MRARAEYVAAGLLGLLFIVSATEADAGDQRYRFRNAQQSGVYDQGPRNLDQWYAGEYPFRFATYDDVPYERGCRMGWWQSSYFGHPRPQWATYCRR